MADWKRIHDILQSAKRDVRDGIAVAHTLETPDMVELGNLLIDARYDYEALERKIEAAEAEEDLPSAEECELDGIRGLGRLAAAEDE